MGFDHLETSDQALNGPTFSQPTSIPASFYGSSISQFSGLTRYASVRDSDLQSVASSDDTASVAESVFSDNQDAQSIVSSQSSYSSAGSDSSEEGSDGENTSITGRANFVKPISNNHTDQREELLSGLSSETLPFRTLPPPKKHEASQSSTLQQANNVPPVSQATNPPRLKRDTDSSDCFVGQLISFATRLITAIWPKSGCPPLMSSSFNGAGVLPLEVFIHETLRRSKTSFSTLQVALWYLVMLQSQMPAEGQNGTSDCRAMDCGRRMFLAALMLASKYLQDRNYSTRAWSKISGLRMCEINENEMHYLKAINYSLHMKKDVFDNWHRLVLSLSKLSRAKPGCPISGWRTSGSGHSNALAAMVSEDSQPGLELFTCQWWQDVLKQLNPQICQDAASTEGFLHKVLPQSIINDPRMDLSSTVGTTGFTADSPFSDASPVKGFQSASSTPIEYTQSPAEASTALPLQPHLRNLPTPVSTPRPNDGYHPWLLKSDPSAPSLRCSASVDAFRNVRKQCLANANLDKCPPPRPQSYHCAGARPAVSSHFNPFPLPSPATSLSSGRSRSSSISSTSSWSPSSAIMPGVDQLLPYRTQEPSPLTRVVSMPESRHPAKFNGEHPLRRKPQCSDIASARSHAAAHARSQVHKASHSSAVAADVNPQNKNVDDQIAEALVQMARERQAAASRARASCLETRGHKRTISTCNERNAENTKPVQQELAAAGSTLSESRISTPTSLADLHKGWQFPAKSWATPKKPMCGPFDHKRTALYCDSKDTVNESAASKYAALYLRDTTVFA
ncbi:G1/S-specific cyclin pas1 [Cyphellophora attinorum]|uniref:G1/S-specific cyclin pas1 n=1 Tax=Cyphellophora attinorum TaxID=1664694 RepID=A0A0N1HBL1_9EURO|nr:G1/S-specific cyclin pas1 [Phialophora attinorum]KPI41720.1 G1/S-specific cyclin pas1 [Phialophora attinorum]